MKQNFFSLQLDLNAPDTDGAVDNHIYKAMPVITAASNTEIANPPLEQIYSAARPVLLIVRDMLFFKKGWKLAIIGLIAVLDAEYPSAKQ